MAAWLVSLIIFISPSIMFLTPADPRPDLVARSCRHDPVRGAENYNRTFWEIVGDMENEVVTKKFAFRAAGDPPDKLFVFSQCYQDLSRADCSVCFDRITRLLPSCFPATGGRVFFDGCFIRAENYSFFQETTTPDDLLRCSDSVDERVKFRTAALKAINEAAQKAVENGGFYLQQQKLGEVSVYAMASCWKLLPSDMCSSCLNAAVQASTSCLPSTEGRVLNAGCNLRYSDYNFSNEQEDRPENSIMLYISYLLGVITLCLLVVIMGYFAGKYMYKRKSRRRKPNGLEKDMEVNRILQYLQFKYSTLERATECFNESHRLGQGGYGEVFKGTLPDGREIAIKRLFISGEGRTEGVYNEIDIISRAQHKNLVRFLGCCFTFTNSFLVYEFLANSSLDRTLFDPVKKRELDWKRRLGIIMGTAEGLEYLHKDCQVRIIHRDIKASNILLDLKYRPKISDFGLARFYSCENSLISTAIAGTLGYMAPEYLAQGRLTEKVDVYSFGVLVLEIISGERNIRSQAPESGETLVTRAWRHFQSSTVSEVIDQCMEAEDLEVITRVVQVGLLCTQEAPSSRPAMTMVIQLLKQNQAVLPAPSKPPFTDQNLELSSSFYSFRWPASSSSSSFKDQ